MEHDKCRGGNGTAFAGQVPQGLVVTFPLQWASGFRKQENGVGETWKSCGDENDQLSIKERGDRAPRKIAKYVANDSAKRAKKAHN